MLEVIFYQTTDDLSTGEASQNPLIICPSPLVADGLRRLLPKNSEVVTISKWVTDFLKAKKLKRSNKADLMLRLSSVWRHYFPNEDAHYFFKSFELFTDLRSFSLNIEMLSEFLKEIDEVTTKSVLIFWSFLQSEKLNDEHLSYQMLSDDESIESTKPIWIIGFKHLSGIQIDMLKLVAEKTNVFVFFPKDIYPETLSTDWIRWLLPEKKVEINNKVKKLNVIHYPKNKLNIVLEAIKKVIPSFDIALASQSATLNIKQEVAVADLFFKSQEDLFRTQREALIEELSEDFNVESSKKSINLDDFILKIQEKKKSALLIENFILYKTLILLNEALLSYGEFQQTVDPFTLKVLKLILELNSPRVALATLAINHKNRLLELNELPYSESQAPLLVIASSSYGPLKSQQSNYSEKMIEALKAIAPIKRSGLDFLYLKSELSQVLSKKGNLLLIEEGLEMIDLSWREILKNFELSLMKVNADYRLKAKNDYLITRVSPGPYLLKNVSASRLQLFMDCPRKYYFSYLDKIDHRPIERLKIAADEMGTLEHGIIENFFLERVLDSNLVFESALHELICQQALDEFVSLHKIKLSEKTKLTTYYELVHYTKNGIDFLINFCKENEVTAIEFERPLDDNSWRLVGSMDCLVYLQNDKVAVFDFKRSGAAIGSKHDTITFDKIQIWVYLLIILKAHNKKIQSWGYLNLSDIETSLIFNEEDRCSLAESVVNSFQEFLEKKIVELNSEIDFFPKPRNAKICHFCEIELFCSKGSCL